MGNIKCFLIEPNGIESRWLRVFHLTSDGNKCPLEVNNGMHEKMVKMPDGPANTNWKEDGAEWPATCNCGYEFTADDYKQFHTIDQYVCSEKPGHVFTIRNAPVGAIWRATWYEDLESMRGSDGKSYVCQTPGGTWIIDSVASNCGRKEDTKHKCWCRHGEAPNFTVDKSCNTCNAGAGSIAQRGYHGFLQNGYLTNC